MPWIRAYRLDEDRPDILQAGNVPIGYCKERQLRREVDRTRRLLARLSAAEERAAEKAGTKLNGTEFKLLDAWFLNSAQLRTRWEGDRGQFVVRAFQHDPLRESAIALVGEGLVSSPLDVVDFQLRDAFYPLLFIFCEADGAILGCLLLAFPSLCRGGAHYPELIGAAQIAADHEVDVVSYSEMLAVRLLALLDKDAEPAVERLSCELDGADGSEPLLQPRMRGWLEMVLRVALEARASGETPADRIFESVTSLDASDLPRDGAARLLLSHDMVPTIAALTEPRSYKDAKRSEAIVPLLVAGHDPSMPVSLVQVPPDLGPLLGELDGQGTWPRLIAAQSSLPCDFPPAAIRTSRRNGPGDSELLVPLASSALPTASSARSAVTWLVAASGWHQGDLFLGIYSLSLQMGGDSDVLAIIGQVDRATLSMAQERFQGRVTLFHNFEAAVLAIDTPLAAFVGRGTILHDRRGAGVLSRLLDQEWVASASCVLIRGEKPGRSWHAAGVDLGEMAGETGRRPKDHDRDVLVEQLWRSTYPVASPPRDLWLARSSNVRAWIKEGPVKTIGGYHLCSFMVTASNVGSEGSGERLAAPPASADHCLKVRANLG